MSSRLPLPQASLFSAETMDIMKKTPCLDINEIIFVSFVMNIDARDCCNRWLKEQKHKFDCVLVPEGVKITVKTSVFSAGDLFRELSKIAL